MFCKDEDGIIKLANEHMLKHIYDEPELPYEFNDLIDIYKLEYEGKPEV